MAKEPAAKAAATPIVKVEALTPIHHDGTPYAVGETIEMTPEQAEALLTLGAAVAVGGTVAAVVPAA